MIPDADPLSKNIACPSYISKAGAELFGIINKAGKVTYLKNAITIDNTFVEEAKTGREAEARFRFSGKCITTGCLHWDNTNHQCILIDKLISILDRPVSETVQDCPIR